MALQDAQTYTVQGPRPGRPGRADSSVQTPGIPSTDENPPQRHGEKSQDGGHNQVGDGLIGVQRLDGEVHRTGQDEQERADDNNPQRPVARPSELSSRPMIGHG